LWVNTREGPVWDIRFSEVIRFSILQTKGEAGCYMEDKRAIRLQEAVAFCTGVLRTLAHPGGLIKIIAIKMEMSSGN